MGGVRRSRLCLCDVWTSSRSTLQSDQDGSGSSQQQATSNACTTRKALVFFASPLEACGGGFVAFASLVVGRWSQEPPASAFFCETSNDSCGGALWRVGGCAEPGEGDSATPCVLIWQGCPPRTAQHVYAVTRMSRYARVARVLRSEAVELSHVRIHKDMTGC